MYLSITLGSLSSPLPPPTHTLHCYDVTRIILVSLTPHISWPSSLHSLFLRCLNLEETFVLHKIFFSQYCKQTIVSYISVDEVVENRIHFLLCYDG